MNYTIIIIIIIIIIINDYCGRATNLILLFKIAMGMQQNFMEI
jgi:hypothetical protein